MDSLPDELKPTLIRQGLRIADQLTPSGIKKLFEAAPVEFRDELIPALLRSAQLVNDEGRLMILTLLAPVLASELWPKVLEEVVAKIEDRWRLFDAAELLAKYLSAETLGAVLSSGYRVGEWISSMWVGAFAPFADKQSLREALETAGVCAANERTSYEAIEALIAIASHLDEDSIHRGLYIAQHLQDAEQRVQWLAILDAVAQQKKSSNKQTASDTMSSSKNVGARANHEQQATLDQQASLSGLQAIAELQDMHKRYTGLKQLVPRLARNVLPGLVSSLPDLLPGWPGGALTLLSLIVPRLDDRERERALSGLAPLLSRIPSGESGLNEDLDRLAPYLSEAVLSETLVLARQVRDEKAQNDAMVALLPHLSTEMKEHVLKLSLKLFDEDPLHFELPDVLPHLAQEQIEALLDKILTLVDKDRIGSEEQLVVIARGTPTGYARVCESLLDLGPGIDPSRGHYLFEALIPKLTGPTRNKALESWLATGPIIIGRGLKTVAKYLTEAHLLQLMRIGNQVRTAFAKADNLQTLSTILPMNLLEEAPEMAQSIEEREYKVQALAALKARKLARFSEEIPEATRHKLAEEVLSLVRESASDDLLAEIGGFLSQDRLREAIDVPVSIRGGAEFLSRLGKVASFLDQELATEALHRVGQCAADSFLRIQVLLDLLPLVPANLRDTVIEEAAEKTLSVSDAIAYEVQVEDLWTVSHHISTDLLRRLLTGARERNIENYAVIGGYWALSERVPLDEAKQLRSTAFALVHAVDSASLRKKALERLGIFDEAQRAQWLLEVLSSEPKSGPEKNWLNTEQVRLEMGALPATVRLRIWNDVLRQMETMSRPKMLEHLSELLPVLTICDRNNWGDEALKAIEDAARWWR